MSIISDDSTDFKKVDINSKNPVTKPETLDCDRNFENCIRPKSFDAYIGQSALKETLKITIAAAKKREQTNICSRFWSRRRDLKPRSKMQKSVFFPLKSIK